MLGLLGAEEMILMIRLRNSIQAVLPCLCAFLLMGIYALDLLPQLNLTAINLLCLLLACLALLPGIVSAVNVRKAEHFVSSLAIVLAALTVNLRGQFPNSLSALSAWEVLWAGLTAVCWVCLTVVLLRLMRWSQENWEQERKDAQDRRRNRRESWRNWWKAWGQYWTDRITAYRKYKMNLENQQMADRLNRTEAQIRHRKCQLDSALEKECAPKVDASGNQSTDEQSTDSCGEEKRAVERFTAGGHFFAGLIVAVVLIVIIGLPFAIRLGPSTSLDAEVNDALRTEEDAPENRETYFEQWVTAVQELVSYLKDLPTNQPVDSGNQPAQTGSQPGIAVGQTTHATTGKGSTDKETEDRAPNIILVYLGFVGLLLFTICLAYYILLGFVKRKLRGRGGKLDSKQKSDFLSFYAVPMALLMISLLALYVIGNMGSITDISESLKELLLAIAFILVLLTAFEVVRLVLEQCGVKNSALGRMICLIFFAVLEFMAQLIIGVLKSLHIESVVSSLLMLVLPGEPDELPVQALEKIKRILRSEMDAVSEEAEDSQSAGGEATEDSFSVNEPKTEKRAVHRVRFFRRRVWGREKMKGKKQYAVIQYHRPATAVHGSAGSSVLLGHRPRDAGIHLFRGLAGVCGLPGNSGTAAGAEFLPSALFKGV